jgi:hypothetical protein
MAVMAVAAPRRKEGFVMRTPEMAASLMQRSAGRREAGVAMPKK